MRFLLLFMVLFIASCAGGSLGSYTYEWENEPPTGSSAGTTSGEGGNSISTSSQKYQMSLNIVPLLPAQNLEGSKTKLEVK